MSSIKRVFSATLFAVCTASVATADDTSMLPEPLTLEFALTRAELDHPDVVSAQSEVDAAQAGLALSQSQNGIQLGVQARARWLEPPSTLARYGNEDHALQLTARKRVYDFGQTSKQIAASEALYESKKKLYAATVLERRVAIMRAYFDVVLADIAFAQHNEDMAIAYIRYDRLKDRHELGQKSDIDLLEAEAQYQHVRRQRFAALAEQRASRSRLAYVLNSPGKAPDTVAPPSLSYKERKPPELDRLYGLLDKNSPVLKAANARLEGEKLKLGSISAERFPVLSVEAAAGEYSRDVGSNDLWRAGISLDITLYQGGAVSAKKAQQHASILKAQASLEEQRRTLRQHLMDNWLLLDTLRIQREEKQSEKNYRELYLDRARALYEMEVKTDLGDAMVELTRASLETAQTEFETALAWARIEALVGVAYEDMEL